MKILLQNKLLVSRIEHEGNIYRRCLNLDDGRVVWDKQGPQSRGGGFEPAGPDQHKLEDKFQLIHR